MSRLAENLIDPSTAPRGARVRLRCIDVFPVKSLDGVSVPESFITAGGILEHDRTWAIVDREGRYVNGKRSDRIHHLRSSFDSKLESIGVGEGSAAPEWFRLGEPALDRWLTAFFGFPVSLRHEPEKGFPDDREAFGPTIISRASLLAVREWFPDLSVVNLRRRFRSNLELDGEEAFWEDRLFGAPSERKPFHLGSVKFFGHNPCQRCVVPTRDPSSGEPIHRFQKSFSELREAHLPSWANRERFNHFYRFAVNTSIPPSEAGKRLCVGDELHVGSGPSERSSTSDDG